MEELLDLFFENEEMGYHKDYDDEDDPIYITELKAEDGDFPIFVTNARDNQTVNFYIKSPVKISHSNRRTIAEYITRANMHNYEGCLMLDFDDGSLFYKNTLRYDPVEDKKHILYQLHATFNVGMEEMETHFPGILNVVYNDIDPAQALTKAEYGSNAKLN